MLPKKKIQLNRYILWRSLMRRSVVPPRSVGQVTTRETIQEHNRIKGHCHTLYMFILKVIINVGTRWRWMVNLTPRPLYPREENPGNHERGGLGGPQSRYGRFGEERCRTGIRASGRPVHRLIATPTTLPSSLPVTAKGEISYYYSVYVVYFRAFQETRSCSAVVNWKACGRKPSRHNCRY